MLSAIRSWKAEIKPVEPETDNTGAGIGTNAMVAKILLSSAPPVPMKHKGVKIMAAIENVISQAIISKFSAKLQSGLNLDAALVGAGPSALVAARYLAEAGVKCAIFERKLAPGGGTWGGGMLFNEAVVQTEALPILDDFAIPYEEIPGHPGYYTLDSVAMASGLIFGALKAGAMIFNTMSVEDLVFKNGQIGGLVVNWTPVERLGMHVDPLTVLARTVIDGTGHPSEIMRMATEKAGIKLNTPDGKIQGERPMWVDQGEAQTVGNTKEYFPGLYACGMSANNTGGGYRMGPIFGGMLLSGRKVAGLVKEFLDRSC